MTMADPNNPFSTDNEGDLWLGPAAKPQGPTLLERITEMIERLRLEAERITGWTAEPHDGGGYDLTITAEDLLNRAPRDWTAHIPLNVTDLQPIENGFRVAYSDGRAEDFLFAQAEPGGRWLPNTTTNPDSTGVTDYAAVAVRDGSRLNMHGGALLEMRDGSSLNMHGSALLEVGGTSRIYMPTCAKIEMRDGGGIFTTNGAQIKMCGGAVLDMGGDANVRLSDSAYIGFSGKVQLTGSGEGAAVKGLQGNALQDATVLTRGYRLYFVSGTLDLARATGIMDFRIGDTFCIVSAAGDYGATIRMKIARDYINPGSGLDTHIISYALDCMGAMLLILVDVENNIPIFRTLT